MKSFYATLVIFLLLVGSGRCFSQGFVNLNFENAAVSTVPGYSFYAYASDAIPGWTAYFGSNPQSIIEYDSLSGGGASIFLMDSNAPPPYGPIQGNYSVLLYGGLPGAQPTVSIGQTGTIPSTAQSLIFWDGLASLNVSFDGQSLSLVDVSNAVNYTVYAANISAFAGETGQLLFTVPVNYAAILDNIQFSTSPVPEPGPLALCALGGLTFVWRRKKRVST